MITPRRFLKRYLKTLVEKIFKITVYRTLPRGVDPIFDLERFYPGWKPTTIFDVGANIGQSAIVYSKKFPSSNILSFEPASETFRHLKKNLTAFQNIQCFRLAFAPEAGDGMLVHGGSSDLNRIVETKTPNDSHESSSWEQVEKKTIDGFCKDRAITVIDYLKIDTEGSDLDVLRGAEQMLINGLIYVIEVEVGFGLDNDTHVPLLHVQQHLESRGYSVFGFYEQIHEWKRHLPHLRRTNVLFISEKWERTMCCGI